MRVSRVRNIGDFVEKGGELVNRETGAVLRVLLDDGLEKEGILL